MPDIYRPTDVLDQHVDMIRFWARNPMGRAAGDEFMRSYDTDLDQNQPGPALVQTFRGVQFSTFLASRLDVAETFFVRKSVQAQLLMRARQYEHSDGVQITDLPSQQGFMWLEDPLHIKDVHGRNVPICALLWSLEEGGAVIIWFSDRRDLSNDLEREIALQWSKEKLTTQQRQFLESEPRAALFHVDVWPWGRVVADITRESFNETLLRASLARSTAPDPEAAFNQAIRDMVTLNSLVLMLWDFMQHQLPASVRAPRPQLRRLQRTHSRISEIKIVQLRTQKQIHEPNDDPELVMWSHRWRVRGHLRRWIDKNGEYRETWIKPYVKGPQNLPLIEKDTVFDVRR